MHFEKREETPQECTESKGLRWAVPERGGGASAEGAWLLGDKVGQRGARGKVPGTDERGQRAKGGATGCPGSLN